MYAYINEMIYTYDYLIVHIPTVLSCSRLSPRTYTSPGFWQMDMERTIFNWDNHYYFVPLALANELVLPCG